MRKLADHCFHEMEIGGAKGGSGVKDALEGQTILFLAGYARLEHDMRHGAMNGNRDGRLAGVRSKDKTSLWRVTLLRLVPKQVMPLPPVMDEIMLLVLLVMMEESARCWSRICS